MEWNYINRILEKYNVKVLGTPVQSIIDTEDRDIFAKKLDEIDVKSQEVWLLETMEDAIKAAKKLGFPVIIGLLIHLEEWEAVLLIIQKN